MLKQHIITVRSLIESIQQRLDEAELHFGHGTDNALDEAVFLVFHVLNLPFDCDEKELQRELTKDEIATINSILKERIEKKIPLSYLINTAYFAGLEFYVDRRVIIPRSPMAELIQHKFSPWINANQVHNILDLCTGSGCIAIACAKMFPQAQVDAVEIDADAIEVAKINVAKHGVEHQVNLLHGDLFAPIKNQRYDVIISNPPYVGAKEMKTIPAEYRHEPKISLLAEDEGLEIVIRILQNAKKYLTDHGILIVEVGNSQELLMKRFPQIPFTWLTFEHGDDGVFLLGKGDLSLL